MNVNDYQDFTETTAIYPGRGTGSKNEYAYLGLGLTGEAGEVAEKIKKLIRDGEMKRDEVLKELGDVFWYATQLCSAMGVSVEYVLELNMNKLNSRKERGVLQGSGDNR